MKVHLTYNQRIDRYRMLSLFKKTFFSSCLFMMGLLFSFSTTAQDVSCETFQADLASITIEPDTEPCNGDFFVNVCITALERPSLTILYSVLSESEAFTNTRDLRVNFTGGVQVIPDGDGFMYCRRQNFSTLFPTDFTFDLVGVEDASIGCEFTAIDPQSFMISTRDCECDGETPPPTIICPADITASCGESVEFCINTSGGIPIVRNNISGFNFLGLGSNGNSYFVSAIPVTWMQANLAAQANGGHLLTIGDAMEYASITNLPGFAFATREPWIGLNDTSEEGVFEWANCEPVAFISEDFTDRFTTGNNDASELHTYILELEGGLQIFQTSGGFNSHDIFPVGTTTLCYQGVDLCGNQTEECCLFCLTRME